MRHLMMLLLPLLMAKSLCAQQDRFEVTLNDGNVRCGSIVEETDFAVTLHEVKHTAGGGNLSADIKYLRANIASTLNISQEYRRLVSQAANTLESHEALASWCGQHGLLEEAASQALLVIAEAPQHSEMRAILLKAGYVEIHGKWIKEDNYLVEKGLERYHDHIYIKKDAQDLKVVVSKQVVAEQILRQQSDELARLQALLNIDQQSLADNKSRQTGLDTTIKNDETKLADAPKALADAQKELASIEKNNAAQKSSGRNYGRRTRSLGPSSAQIRAEKDTKQNVDDVQQQIGLLQTKRDQDKHKQTVLVEREKHLNDEIGKTTGQITKLTGVVAAAKAASEVAKKETEAALVSVKPAALPYAR